MPISTPTQITVPFATSGLKNAIPAAANPVTGNAGYDAGFPATNMTPKEAGGIPPFGQDFNGILFDITTAIQYLEAGMQFPYSSTFATAVGGYPLGAIVTRTDGSGFWRNTVANNTTNPETFGAGWAPEGAGISTVAMSNANVTLTALQAARPIIIITGTLTANLQLIFPTYQRQWLVVNNATGAFSVTCKTSAGSGISIAAGLSQSVYGDGTNINTASAAQTQQSVVGGFSSLSASSTGTNALVSVSAAEICLQAAAGVYLTARAVSLPSISLAGSGANGLDTGTSVASTWYSVWVISNGTTTAGLLSLSATSPTMPAGYTFKARVGWVRSDGTANKYPLSFIQAGRSVQYKVGGNVAELPKLITGISGNPVTPTWTPVSTANFFPSTVSSIFMGLYNQGASTQTTAAPSNSYGAVNATTNMPMCNISNSAANSNQNNFLIRMIPESSNVYYASNATVSHLSAFGWEDNL